MGRKLAWAPSGGPNRGSASAENRLLRSACTRRLSVRSVSTSLNSLVASLRRERRLSTTVCEWSAAWRLGPAEGPADMAASSAMPALRDWMSAFTRLDSSPISWAGSSNMEVRRASAASCASFWLVEWMPSPMAAAWREKAEWDAGVGEAGAGVGEGGAYDGVRGRGERG